MHLYALHGTSPDPLALGKRERQFGQTHTHARTHTLNWPILHVLFKLVCLQEAPTAVTGVEQAQGEKQQGQEQVEATESQVAATDAAAQMEGQQGSGLAGLPPLLHDAVTEGRLNGLPNAQGVLPPQSPPCACFPIPMVALLALKGRHFSFWPRAHLSGAGQPSE
eukprot:1159231-Pelagomonas_calceolata.AAC.6